MASKDDDWLREAAARWEQRKAEERAKSLRDDEEYAKFADERARFEEERARLMEERASFEEERARLEGERAHMEEERARLQAERAHLDEERRQMADALDAQRLAEAQRLAQETADREAERARLEEAQRRLEEERRALERRPGRRADEERSRREAERKRLVEEVERRYQERSRAEAQQAADRGVPVTAYRKTPRLALCASVMLQKAGEPVVLPVRNVSLGGALISSEGQDLSGFAPASTIELMLFATDDINNQVDVTARVVRHDPEAMAVDWSEDMGATFKIAALLDSLPPQQP